MTAHSANAIRPALDDMARMWRWAHDQGVATELKRLHAPCFRRSLAAALGDWLVILAAYGAVLAWGPLAAPVAVILIGNRQRAIGNLLHDASHGSFARNRRRADVIARLLLFLPMWTSLDLYRHDHFAHHRLLGAEGHDVDLIHCEADMGRSWPSLLWRHLGNLQTWRASCLGHLHRADPAEYCAMLAWWCAILIALAILVSPADAILFLVLWVASRATSFHLITTFREISDHVGLRPGSILGFARNQTSRGILGAFFHPHNNGYHLVHHLNPGMPFHALPKAHDLLLGWPDYAAATHGAEYFVGNTALVRSWVRQTPGRSGAVSAETALA